MSHVSHLASLINLENLVVVDVGAGSGAFARAFAKRGARVIGIEIDQDKVEIARRTHHPDVEIRLGRGENLPIDDASADLICFMFSLHHIPKPVQDKALFEAYRVLKPAGRMHVVEPRPYGSSTAVMIHLDDETEVRNQAQHRLDQLAEGDLFSRLSQKDYVIAHRIPDFETYVQQTIAVDPERAKTLPSVRDSMEATFNRLAERDDDGFTLEQPCVAHHFEKVVPTSADVVSLP